MSSNSRHGLRSRVALLEARMTVLSVLIELSMKRRCNMGWWRVFDRWSEREQEKRIREMLKASDAELSNLRFEQYYYEE